MPLTTVGRDVVASLIVGGGSPYNAANAHLGVGNSTTAFSASQTDLVGASKHRELVNGAPSVAANVITFIATFETGDANFAWQEVGVFNHASAGTMLCRVVQSLGTKSAGDWILTHQVTLTAA